MNRSRRLRLASPSGGRSPLLPPAELERAARDLLSTAASQGVKAAVAGGLALQQYGSPRLTGDLDVVASAPIAGFRKQKSLVFGGESVVGPGGVPTDIIRRDDAYRRLYAAGLRHAKPVNGMLIIQPEYLAAMKLAAGRTKDIADLEWMFAERVVNLRKAMEVVAEYVGGEYAARDLETIAMEVEWKRKRGML